MHVCFVEEACCVAVCQADLVVITIVGDVSTEKVDCVANGEVSRWSREKMLLDAPEQLVHQEIIHVAQDERITLLKGTRWLR